MGYLYNGVETTGVPIKMIKKIIEGFEVDFFVETGTAGAYSIVEASKHFPICYTIELIEGRTPTHKEEIVYDKDVIDEESGEIIKKADPTIADHVLIPINYPENITFCVGDSTEILPNINNQVNSRYAVYWLDAHYSDPDPSPEGCVECPIVAELEAISDNQKAIIVIDDARLFLGTPPPPLKPNEWIGVQSLLIAIEHYFNNHHITIIDDYVVAVPMEMKDNLNAFWLETYKQRFK